MARANGSWPELDYASWRPTLETLHRWLQILGKVQLAECPWVNHAWHSTLRLSARGIGSPLLHHREADGSGRAYSLEMDLLDPRIRIRVSDGRSADLPLRAEPVAEFHDRLLGALRGLGLEVGICGVPNELPDATPFREDRAPRAFDPDAARRFWRALLAAERVMNEFRARFLGKSSPVHLFWGSLDLAVTRFSGRTAPEHPGGVPHLPDLIAREAYSHEVSSCGFWPGSAPYPHAAFYSYAYPPPAGFERTPMPEGAFFHPQLREFVLPYERVRAAAEPERLVLDFFQRSYEAAAELGGWDRALLEHSPWFDAIAARRSEAA